MYCTQDCTCSLCRELRGFNLKPAIVHNQSKHSNAGPSNDNFILRRRLSDTEDSRAPVRIVDSVNKKSLTKSKSYSELWKRFDPRNVSKKKVKDAEMSAKDGGSKKADGHKVIIYFGDSMPHKRQPLTPYKTDGNDFEYASRLCNEIDEKKSTKVMITKEETNAKRKVDDQPVKSKSEVDVMMQLKTVLSQKNNPNCDAKPKACVNKTVLELPPKPAKFVDKSVETRNGGDLSLPSFIESVVNGVVNVKVENNFKHASELVKCISNGVTAIGSDGNDDYFDWSFVQDWRTR